MKLASRINRWLRHKRAVLNRIVRVSDTPAEFLSRTGLLIHGLALIFSAKILRTRARACLFLAKILRTLAERMSKESEVSR